MASGRERPVFLRCTDPLLRWGCPALLCFATVAWGSVETWSVMVLVGGCSTLAALWLLRRMTYPGACAGDREAGCHFASWSAVLHWPVIALFGIGVLQVIPLDGIVALVSPVAARIQVQAGISRSSLTLSLAPGATMLALAELSVLALLFFTLLDTLQGRIEVRRLTASLMLLGFVHALVGIVWHYERIKRADWGAYSLPFGFSMNRNHFANQMAMIIPLGIGYLASIGQRQSIRSRKPDDGAAPTPVVSAGSGVGRRVRQVLVGCATLVMVGGLYLSKSRGGILATVVALGTIFLGFVWWRQRQRRFQLPLAVIVTALAFGAWIAGEISGVRLAAVGNVASERSAMNRVEIWRDTARMVADYPLFGTGFGTYGEVFPGYQSALAELKVAHAHNDWLQVLVEGGIAGFLAVLACLAGYAVAVARLLGSRRDREAIFLGLGGLGGLLAFLLHSFVEFNAHIPANALWFTVLAALTLKALASRRPAG